MVQVLPGRSVHKRVQNKPGQFLEAVIELGKTRRGFDKGAPFLLTEPTLALQLTGWPVLRGDPFPSMQIVPLEGSQMVDKLKF